MNCVLIFLNWLDNKDLNGLKKRLDTLLEG